MSVLEGFVWLLTPFAQVLVIIKLIRCRIGSSLPAFLAFLVFDVCRSFVLWWIGRSPYTGDYRRIWIASEPILLALQFLVVLELYRLLYKSYPGIHKFARVLIGLGILFSLTTTFATVRFDVGKVIWTIPDLQRLFVVKRLVCSILGLLVLVTMAFFPRAPSAKNVLLHGWLLAALLSIAAVGFFAINLGTSTEWIGTAFLVSQMVCFIWWAVGLKRPEPRRPPPSAEEIERVETLNRELLAVARWLTH